MIAAAAHGAHVLTHHIKYHCVRVCVCVCGAIPPPPLAPPTATLIAPPRTPIYPLAPSLLLGSQAETRALLVAAIAADEAAAAAAAAGTALPKEAAEVDTGDEAEPDAVEAWQRREAARIRCAAAAPATPAAPAAAGACPSLLVLHHLSLHLAPGSCRRDATEREAQEAAAAERERLRAMPEEERAALAAAQVC